jgi:hypothetical protein
MEIHVIELCPFHIAEGDELDLLALEDDLASLVIRNIRGGGEGVIDFEIVTVNALEGIGHVMGTPLLSFVGARAAANLSVPAIQAGLKIIGGFKGILTHLRDNDLALLLIQKVHVDDLPDSALLLDFQPEILIGFRAIRFYKFRIRHSFVLLFRMWYGMQTIEQMYYNTDHIKCQEKFGSFPKETSFRISFFTVSP